jgi:hypothetical protein
MGKRLGAFAVLAAVMAVGEVNAGLLPVQFGVTPEGSDFRYTYNIHLQSGAVLKTGDYFTIFDFAGLVDSSNVQPGGFSFSTSPSGPAPSVVQPADDGSIANVTWTYTGTDTVGPNDLGNFSAVSHYNTTTDDSFAGQTHRQADGRLNSNITDTRVPVPSMPPGHQVPEPSTLLLLIAGLPLAFGVRTVFCTRA